MVASTVTVLARLVTICTDDKNRPDSPEENSISIDFPRNAFPTVELAL